MRTPQASGMVLQSDEAPNAMPRSLLRSILLDKIRKGKTEGEPGRSAAPEPEAWEEAIEEAGNKEKLVLKLNAERSLTQGCHNIHGQ